MSRVYDALRLSELERGAPGSILDPDTFLAPPNAGPILLSELEASTVTTVLEPDGFLPSPPATTTVFEEPRQPSLRWDEMVSVTPALKEESRVVTLTEEKGLAAEKFRLLRARLRNLRERQQLRKLVITSAVPGDGKTFVAMNLAIALAKHTTERVLLLEGDLRKPMLGTHLGISGLAGIGDWGAGTESISKFICHFDDLQLWILPAGSAPDNPATILQSERFLDCYNHLSKCFDWILVDAPPLLPMADANFWSRQADGLLLVVREGRTPKSILQKGLETLDNPKLIGVVLNEAQEGESSYYKRYYGKNKPT